MIASEHGFTEGFTNFVFRILSDRDFVEWLLVAMPSLIGMSLQRVWNFDDLRTCKPLRQTTSKIAGGSLPYVSTYVLTYVRTYVRAYVRTYVRTLNPLIVLGYPRSITTPLTPDLLRPATIYRPDFY